MHNRWRVAAVAAIAFGLVAAYGVFDFLRTQRLAAETLRQVTHEVVVAAREIPAGTRLAPEMLRVAPYLERSLPSGAYSSPDQVSGQVVASKVGEGEPLVQSRLVDKAGLTTRLTPGHRAMAVKVNEIVGVSGFIVPEDRVDVIATVSPPGKSKGDDQISRIVLQNKRVLSVAQQVEGTRDGKPVLASSITLELTPQESETLSLASLEGQVLLALRSSEDSEVIETRGRTTNDLVGRAAPTNGRRAPGYSVVVYQGADRSVVSF